MFSPFKSLVHLFQLPRVEDLEASYLEASYDRLNLEYRQRQIEQGLFRKPR